MTAPTQDLTALLNTLQSAQTTAPTADTIDTPPVHHTPLALPQGPLSPSGTSSSLPPSEPLERFGDRYFAPRSRIFVGNLASSDITEADIRTIFQPYGKIEVITLKSTYGFVQYDNPDSCARALQNENGRMIKGVRLELDLSKASNAKPPGRGRGEQRFDPYKREDGGRGRGMGRGRGRRSASPGPNYPPPFHPMPPPRRGPPPPAPGYGAPQYDAPYDRPYRTSMEPDGEYARRYAQPPFCQILVLDDLDRNFVGFVEGALKRAQITVEAMALPPHVQIRTAVLQKIREGVRAVIFLERKHEQYGRVSLQVFEPRVGDTGVKFEGNPIVQVVMGCRVRRHSCGRCCKYPAACQRSPYPRCLCPHLFATRPCTLCPTSSARYARTRSTALHSTTHASHGTTESRATSHPSTTSGH
jgi:hypothetical protein